MCVHDNLHAKPEVFLELNKSNFYRNMDYETVTFSNDGKVFAFAKIVSGSDWHTIHFMDTTTGSPNGISFS